MVPQINLVSPNIVPLPVQQAADVQQLGPFLKAYTKASIIRMLVVVAILLVAGVAFLAGGLFATDVTTSAKVLLSMIGVFELGAAASLVPPVVQAIKQRIYLFQQGIVIDQGGQLQPFAWNQTAEVWQRVVRRYQYGIYVGTTYAYTLRRIDGYQVKLGNLTKGIAELGPAIAQGVTRALVPRAWQALQGGQTLTFASFSINQQGIGNGREWLPWSQVQAITVKRGWVNINKAGTSRAWGTALAARVPNVLVFTAIAAELKKGILSLTEKELEQVQGGQCLNSSVERPDGPVPIPYPNIRPN